MYSSLEEALPVTDVLYMTRIQQERFSSPEEYNKVFHPAQLLQYSATPTDERLLHLNTKAVDTGQVSYDHNASLTSSE